MSMDSILFILIGLFIISFNAKAEERILIKSIEPPISESLEVGQDYEIKIKAKYISSKETGKVGLNIQRAEADYPPLCVIRKNVQGESGMIDLSCKITVVNTPSITVFVPYYGEEGKSTSTVDGRVYETVDNRNGKCFNK
ncbi:MAG: hypothetical protein JAZ18_02205 [Candidatus Thiodiazotropha endolucinida]|nr:hypothetical protein [Candidatus Thiodiazotropha endolucinida]